MRANMQSELGAAAAVNGNKVEAQYRNGVLELHLPRIEEAQRRRIDVKS
jgi:HSP20 family molecular chaperone IbpA